MAQKALITVQRGHNIGRSIIDYLTDNNLYTKVNILSFNFERNVNTYEFIQNIANSVENKTINWYLQH